MGNFGPILLLMLPFSLVGYSRFSLSFCLEFIAQAQAKINKKLERKNKKTLLLFI
jgi:hypothetical protein